MRASTALVDGGGGLGHVAGNLAMKLAIDKCRSTGCGIVAVRNSTHYGAAGSYASMAAGAGFLGLSMTSTPQPAVVPTFGIDSMLGTNPISFAAPAGRNNPFLLDMATSTIPFGALMKFWRNGHSIPEGWALDDTGRPVTNARKAAGYRRLSPLGSSREMGGHKGYGLAAMVEILSSILPGRPLPAESGKSTGRVGHFFLVLDPNRFRAKGEFESDLDLMLDALRDGKRVNPEQPILVAGDPEYRAREERAGKGIPISRSIVEDIRMVCGDSGAPFILELK